MGLRVPQSQIITSKYTSGKEYIFNTTYREYIGYYYELNGKLFAGKEFSTTAPELIKMDSNKVNNLLTHPSTYIYGKISGVKINNTKPTSFLYQYDSNKRYFSYQITNKLIKEIDKNNFDSLQANPIYTTITLSYVGGFDDTELKTAEIKTPGITEFVNTSYTNPQVEDDGTIG